MLEPIDLNDLLGDTPPPPAEYVVAGYLERASHVLLCGRGGKGKTMFVNQLCVDAERLDLAVHAHQIVWLDGEMGRLGTRRRYWRTGLRSLIGPGRIQYVNAAGADIMNPDHYAELCRIVDGADLVVIDSLRRISTTSEENSSDHMSAVITAITNMAHELGPAILTIHHQGGDPHKWFRGSTAILDAADGLVGWLPHSFDSDTDDGMRRLAAKGTWAKVRNDRAPEDVWFQQTDAGLFVPAETPTQDVTSKWDEVILGLLPWEGTKTALAEACGAKLTNRAWDSAYKRLVVKRDGVHVQSDYDEVEL
jgi:hypothetical protein